MFLAQRRVRADSEHHYSDLLDIELGNFSAFALAAFLGMDS